MFNINYLEHILKLYLLTNARSHGSGEMCKNNINLETPFSKKIVLNIKINEKKLNGTLTFCLHTAPVKNIP